MSLLYPLALVLLQLYPMTNPVWFYAADVTSNLLSWITISLSAISDVIPNKWRSSCFGILFGGFSLGLALSPILAIPLSHFEVSCLSLVLSTGGFLYSLFYLPETLSKETSEKMRRLRQVAEAEALYVVYGNNNNSVLIAAAKQRIAKLTRILFRPFREMLILNRNYFFRLLAVLAFFSGMSTSGDETLLLYYTEQQLNFKDKDVAVLFIIIGLLGITVQGFGLHRMTVWLGEKRVVVVAFFFGAFHNCIYAFAATKLDIFVAAGIGSVELMAFPTISAIKANNAVSSPS